MTKTEQLKELLKCKQDPIYFIENYVYIDQPGQKVLFKPYEKQKEFVKVFLEKHYIITLKSRQIGFSTISRAIVAWAMTFYSNITVGILSKDGQESTNFARKTRDIIENLPEWMQPGFQKKTEQSFILKNGSELYSSQVNQSNPTGVFRGKTITLLVIDEAAFIPKIKYAYTGLAPSVTRAHQVAKNLGIPYGILIISTPNGGKDHPIGGWFFEMWQNAIEGKNGFYPFKVHYSEAPFTNKEWVEQVKKIISDELDWQQEMELKFITGKNSLFSIDVVTKLQETQPPIETIEREYFNKYKEKIGSGEWRFFAYPNTSKYYIAGIDIAGGYVGNCNSAIQVIDVDTLEQVAEFDGKLRIGDLLQEVKYLVKRFYNNILIVPEYNSIGIRFVEELEEDDELGELLYYTRKYNKEGKIEKLIPGIATTAKTRPQMIDALYWIVTEDPSRVKSERVVNQLLSLDNRLRGNSLSDLSMALAIAYYVASNDRQYVLSKRPVNGNDYQDNQYFKDIFLENLQGGRSNDQRSIFTDRKFYL